MWSTGWQTRRLYLSMKAVSDTVICASSIFFLSDIPKAIGEWRRVLKAGGTIAFSSFGPDWLQPFSRLFNDRLNKYEEQSSTRQGSVGSKTDTPDKCRELINQAGFGNIEISTEQLGYNIQDVEIYWQEIISSTIMRLRLDRVSDNDRKQIKADHLGEIESLRTENGIWIDVPVIFSMATKPS